MNRRSLLRLAFAFFFSAPALGLFAQKKIVVLGSSTAAGTGASSYANAWVGKYTAYVTGLNAGHTVTNLAVEGYNTYQIVPTGTPHPGRPDQDPQRNVTAAVATYHATVVIVNMPTNDVADSYDVSETLLNYRRVKAYCDSAGVAVYFTTSQPRNFTDAGKLRQLMQIRDSTLLQYGGYAIDFWTTVANADATINPAYNSGDGVHLNDAGHEILFQRVKEKPILGAAGTLPVFLTSFRAYPVAAGIQLEWRLAKSDEKPAQEVERSSDGRSFVTIATLPASADERFLFTDAQPLNGNGYYRIKLSTAAAVKYSEVLRISQADKNNGISIYPNPAEGGVLRLQVQRPTDSEALLTLYTAGGITVLRQSLRLPRGTSLQRVVLPPSLPKGIYFINLFDKEQNWTAAVAVQ